MASSIPRKKSEPESQKTEAATGTGTIKTTENKVDANEAIPPAPYGDDYDGDDDYGDYGDYNTGQVSEEDRLRAAKTADSSINYAILKVTPINLIVILIGALYTAAIAETAVSGYFAGAAIGLLSRRYNIKAIRRSLGMDPARIKKFIMSRYYVRFALTVMAMAALLGLKLVSPIGMIVGFSLVMITTVVTLYIIVTSEHT